MAAKRKYYNLIKVIHEEWCTNNGYPTRRKPFFTSGKLREAQKIPVSGTREQETAPSGIRTEDLIDYKKFERMMKPQLEVSSSSSKAQAPRLKRTT
jgi:hypothetical protein